MRHNSIIGFAALLLLALAAAGTLAVVATQREDGDEAVERAAGVPFEIEGYRFTHTIGGPLVPTSPVDVAVASDGRIFVADIGMNRVLAFTPDGALDTGWGDAGMSERLLFPTSLAIGPDGDVYVLQLGDSEVRVLDDNGRTEHVWQVGGSAGQASASIPTAIAVGSDGTVYVPDQRARQIWRYDADGDELDAWLLPPGDSAAGEVWVRDIVEVGERILVTYQQDGAPGGVFAFDLDGKPAELDAPLNAPAPADAPRSPAGITVDASGNIALLYLPDEQGVAPLVVTPQGAWEPQGASALAPINGMIAPGMASDAQGRILLADPARQRVHIYTPAGEPAGGIHDTGENGLLAGLDGIVTGPGDLLYVADPLRAQVIAYTPEGAVEQVFQLPTDDEDTLTTGFTRLRMRVAVDGQGYVYALDEATGRVTRMTPQGDIESSDWLGAEDDEEAPVVMLLAAGEERVFIVDIERQDSLQVYSTSGEDMGLLFEPTGNGAIQDIAVSPDAIYTVELGAGSSPVRAYSPEGEPLGDLVDLSRGDGNENRTGFSLAPDDQGGLLIAAVNVRGGPEFEYQLLQLDPDGDLERLGTLDIPFTTLPDLAVDTAARLYIAAPNDQRIYVYEPVTD